MGEAKWVEHARWFIEGACLVVNYRWIGNPKRLIFISLILLKQVDKEVIGINPVVIKNSNDYVSSHGTYGFWLESSWANMCSCLCLALWSLIGSAIGESLICLSFYCWCEVLTNKASRILGKYISGLNFLARP